LEVRSGGGWWRENPVQQTRKLYEMDKIITNLDIKHLNWYQS